MQLKKFFLKEEMSSFKVSNCFWRVIRMRLDLLVNNFLSYSINQKKIEIFEGHFRRNFVILKMLQKFLYFVWRIFEKLKNNVYNFGLEEANLIKLDLANQIKNIPFQIIENEFEKDPDQRDYIVSNQKLLIQVLNFKIV